MMFCLQKLREELKKSEMKYQQQQREKSELLYYVDELEKQI